MALGAQNCNYGGISNRPTVPSFSTAVGKGVRMGSLSAPRVRAGPKPLGLYLGHRGFLVVLLLKHLSWKKRWLVLRKGPQLSSTSKDQPLPILYLGLAVLDPTVFSVSLHEDVLPGPRKPFHFAK